MSGQAKRYRIGKQFRFDATRGREGGRYDGHSYTAEVVLAAESLSPQGFVVDFGDLAPLKEHIDGHLDHRLLDDVVEDTSDDGLAHHLGAWAHAHLPKAAGAALETVTVRTGRPSTASATARMEFGASHQLRGLRQGHPCGRLHGHSYEVTVSDSASVRLADAPLLLRRYIRSTLDGQVLNEVLPAFNPTSENLARHFSEWLEDRCLDAAETSRVRVSETPSSWAEYIGRPV